jgi:hypothetical protein
MALCTHITSKPLSSPAAGSAVDALRSYGKEDLMLEFKQFSHECHFSGVKMLAFFRRGISI